MFWHRVPILLGSLVLLVAHGALWANGGGYTFGVKFTGSLAPFQAGGTQHVRILDEKLDIDLRRTDASVTIRYTMRNLSGQPERVKFGFPVEATLEDGEIFDEPSLEAEKATQTLSEARRKDLLAAIQQLKGYAVAMDGQPIKSEFVIEPFTTGKIKPFPGSKALKNIAGWMVSEVVFPASSQTVLEIVYSADYLGDESSVSDDERWTARSFVYRLSTGAIWNGPIEKGTVTVRVDGIPASEVEIAKPRERFKRKGDQWVWEFQNLKPTLADDLTIRAIPGYYEHFRQEGPEENPPVLTYLQRIGKWGEGHQRFTAKASSTLTPMHGHTFGPENLARGWADVPWSEGVRGPGIGEWLEIEPSKPGPLLALGVYPGFQSRTKRDLFKENGRPARVEILLNEEFRFTATLGDRPEAQIIPVVGYQKPVKKIRITILGTYSGTKFEDTCITRLVLYDLLRKKPVFNPSR